MGSDMPTKNKTAEPNPVGRPPKYNTPEEMQRLVDLYFLSVRYNQILFSAQGGVESAEKAIEHLSKGDQEIARKGEASVPTITGLGIALDLTRQGLIEYADKDEFSDTIKRAKARVELALEERLYGTSPVGTIFNLKNNFGWKDQTEQTINNRVTLDRTVKRLDGTTDKEDS